MLTVYDWSAEILQQWNEEARPLFPAGPGALWPSERSSRVGFTQMNTRFCTYRDSLAWIRVWISIPFEGPTSRT
ncbi:hypothetical protein NG702_04825 [Pseudarthrobacter sp. MDT3-28]|uniref:hypothetical protein n=1 Tax=Pseudarthrobacter raffinosi TaxID=2953651 RepID=UPI00208E3F5D|nr:hypothetical protein [Pseudarthrobacter sp. MDT3-28]MCO4236754.1 hypothetical protein [Pseudarthrobacter sp. MDT3-28]